MFLLEQVQVRVRSGNCDRTRDSSSSSSGSAECLKSEYKAMKKEERTFTFKLVSALLGLIHPVGQFGNLGQHVVQLRRLSLALHYDGKHSQASQHGCWRKESRG